MGKRWFAYLSALIGCLVFYLAYQQWLSWILLLAVLSLPPLSLLLSLPAMLTARLQVQMPPSVTVGTSLTMQIVAQCLFPVPLCHLQVQVYHTLTRKSWLLNANSYCPTQHCGALNCEPMRGWIYDYLGLFRLPMRRLPKFRVLVRPKPLELDEPDLSNIMAYAWRPKPGGGFAENHELRQYRPGDQLTQIHWKLTAKTGKLILREPMVPDQHRLLVWLTLHGTPQELDRKMGRLLWLSGYLQRHALPFDILAYTATGPQLWHVTDSQTLRRAINSLLCYGPYPDPQMPEMTQQANWQYYIGGEGHEKV